MAAGNIAIRFGARGTCIDVVTACASSTNCIGEAFRNIKHGYSDYIIAGGSEASICELGIGGFAALKALSTSTDPDRASILSIRKEVVSLWVKVLVQYLWNLLNLLRLEVLRF